ncbi:50S ribosomal protein L13 [bacterium]|nr:50S ribosomal protein L13 [candidate division CSSED10-310 bacterium]
MKTVSAKKEDITREWLVLDATDVPLGRLASVVAYILRGKHKPMYTPHVDTGDHVIVINASKVRVTGKKMADKLYIWHTGHPAGLRSRSMQQRMVNDPGWVLKRAVRGMLPKNILGRQMLKKLKVYGDQEHPHTAQAPRDIPFDGRRYNLGK